MIKPYKISVPKSALNNIYKKVRSYPWKMMQNVNGWEYGTNYNFLKKYLNIGFQNIIGKNLKTKLILLKTIRLMLMV